MNPTRPNIKGTIAKNNAPKPNAFPTRPDLIEPASCQKFWSPNVPLNKPIVELSPNVRNTSRSKIDPFEPVIPPNPLDTVCQPKVSPRPQTTPILTTNMTTMLNASDIIEALIPDH